jgi:hypothetical protein
VPESWLCPGILALVTLAWVRKYLLCRFWTTHHSSRKSSHMLSSLREWLHHNCLHSPLTMPNVFILSSTQNCGNICIGWIKTVGRFTQFRPSLSKYLLRDISSRKVDSLATPPSLEGCGSDSLYLSWGKPNPWSDIHLIFLHGRSYWLLLLVGCKKRDWSRNQEAWFPLWLCAPTPIFSVRPHHLHTCRTVNAKQVFT